MATQLIKYEQGSGAGVASGKNVGKIVIGDAFPSTTADGMYDVACDWSGNVYIADVATNAIYKSTEGGNIALFAGFPNNDGFVNGTGTTARFHTPSGIACDKSGNVYVADTANGRVRKIDQNGKVTTIAGGFTSPEDVAVAPNGDIIVADTGAHKIYRVQAGGRVLLVAGSTAGNVAGYIGATKVKGTAAKFNSPISVTCDWSGNIYVADRLNYQVKIIHPDGWVKVFAGTGVVGNVNGIAAVAQFTNLYSVTCDRSGNLYVIDAITTYNRIKLISPNGTVSTFANPVKNEICYGVAVSPAGKIFAVTAAASPAAHESSSSYSSQSESSASSASTESLSSQSESSASTESLSSQSESSASTQGMSTSSRTESSVSSQSESSQSESSASPLSASSVSSVSSQSESSASTESESSASSESSSSESPGSRP